MEIKIPKKPGRRPITVPQDFIPVFVSSPKKTAKVYGVNERTANRWIVEWKKCRSISE